MNTAEEYLIESGYKTNQSFSILEVIDLMEGYTRKARVDEIMNITKHVEFGDPLHIVLINRTKELIK